MKKYLMMMAASASVLFSACSADSDLLDANNSADNKQEIGFNIVANNTTSRSTIVESSNLTTAGKTFDVWCFDGTNAYMNGFKIEYGLTNHTTEWYYAEDANKRYWTNTALDFYAINPSGIVSEESKKTYNPTSGSFDYTIVDEYGTNSGNKTNVDLLYATAFNQKKGSTNTTTQSGEKKNYVTMKFKHALSQLLFKIKYDDESIKGTKDQPCEVIVKSITITGVYPTGKFTFPAKSTEDGKVDSQEGTMTAQTTGDGNSAISITVPIDKVSGYSNGLTLTTTATDINTSKSNPILVIPQGLTNVQLSIQCKIKAYGSYIKGAASGEEDVQWATVTKNISNETISSWAQGKKYTYTLNIAAGNDNDLIMFDATAETWGEGGSTDITVQ